jgi:hypothetical protein
MTHYAVWLMFPDVSNDQYAFIFLGQADQARLLGPEEKRTMIVRNVCSIFSNNTAKYSLSLQAHAQADVPFIFENNTNRSIQGVDKM